MQNTRFLSGAVHVLAAKHLDALVTNATEVVKAMHVGCADFVIRKYAGTGYASVGNRTLRIGRTRSGDAFAKVAYVTVETVRVRVTDITVKRLANRCVTDTSGRAVIIAHARDRWVIDAFAECAHLVGTAMRIHCAILTILESTYAEQTDRTRTALRID